MSDTQQDRVYADAAVAAVGKALAGMFLAMIDEGMTRQEALAVVAAYAAALAQTIQKS